MEIFSHFFTYGQRFYIQRWRGDSSYCTAFYWALVLILKTAKCRTFWARFAYTRNLEDPVPRIPDVTRWYRPRTRSGSARHGFPYLEVQMLQNDTDLRQDRVQRGTVLVPRGPDVAGWYRPPARSSWTRRAFPCLEFYKLQADTDLG